jgi:hypothetical protein
VTVLAEFINYPTSGPREHFYVEWRLRPKKDGTPGKRVDTATVQYCPIYECDCCKARSGGHRIQYRSLLARVLCMPCWNRLRVIEREQRALDELGRLQRKLARMKHGN